MLVTNNLNIFNKFFHKDRFKVGLLFKLQEEKSGFVTLFLYVQLCILGNQCDVTNSNSLTHEFTSYKSRTQWDERKQNTASWLCYIKNRKSALHFAIKVHLARTSFCENFHRSTHLTKAGGISCTKGIGICMTLRTAAEK